LQRFLQALSFPQKQVFSAILSSNDPLDFSLTFDYINSMFEIKRTPEFTGWLDGLKDKLTHARLVRRLEKAAKGNLGDVEPVGEGVNEMREHFGTGWRMYYTQRGRTLIVMLGGGDKSTQNADIKQARKLAATMED
jgi:putative addiction module killer protein